MSLAVCRPYTGRSAWYQQRAHDVVADRVTLGPTTPYVHVTPTCGTPMCLLDEHLRIWTARRLAYPEGACVYCGMPATCRDHLMPSPLTGSGRRSYVAVVPACTECNALLGDAVEVNMTARRELAHKRLAKRYARYLAMPKQWTPTELRTLGPNLRSRVAAGLAKAEVAAARLAWPDDAGYDLRAFEKSGIPDPIALELL